MESSIYGVGLKIKRPAIQCSMLVKCGNVSSLLILCYLCPPSSYGSWWVKINKGGGEGKEGGGGEGGQLELQTKFFTNFHTHEILCIRNNRCVMHGRCTWCITIDGAYWKVVTTRSDASVRSYINYWQLVTTLRSSHNSAINWEVLYLFGYRQNMFKPTFVPISFVMWKISFKPDKIYFNFWWDK